MDDELNGTDDDYEDEFDDDATSDDELDDDDTTKCVNNLLEQLAVPESVKLSS